MKSFKKIVVAAATTALFASAQAATTTTTIDAYAGLAPVLTVSCTPVSFGVWRMPVRTSGGTTIVTLTLANDTATATGNVANVALASTLAWQPYRGQCTVGGSQQADTTKLLITVPSGATTMVSDAASPFTSLSAPSTAISAMTFTLNGPAANTIALSGGAATFYVGGVLTVPETIAVVNYGAYKGASTTITVSDVP